MESIQVVPEPSSLLGNQDVSAYANGGLDATARFEFKKISVDKWVVKDSEGEPRFGYKSCNTAIRCQGEVYLLAGGIEYPFLKLQKQIVTLHARCDGYSISIDNSGTYGEKLFSLSTNGILQKYTDLNVKLYRKFPDNGASLESEEHRALLNDLLETDRYKIVGSWDRKSFNIYNRDSSTEIAKVRPLDTIDRFMVEVSSNVDCAFVISLIAAVDCMKDPGTLKNAGKAIGFVLKAAAGAASAAAGEAGYSVLFS